MLSYHIFVAKRQATAFFNKILDTLLHAQQVMPPNEYICDVLMVHILALYGNSLYLRNMFKQLKIFNGSRREKAWSKSSRSAET